MSYKLGGDYSNSHRFHNDGDEDDDDDNDDDDDDDDDGDDGDDDDDDFFHLSGSFCGAAILQRLSHHSCACDGVPLLYEDDVED